jgi:hypothetical protein
MERVSFMGDRRTYLTDIVVDDESGEYLDISMRREIK